MKKHGVKGILALILVFTIVAVSAPAFAEDGGQDYLGPEDIVRRAFEYMTEMNSYGTTAEGLFAIELYDMASLSLPAISLNFRMDGQMQRNPRAEHIVMRQIVPLGTLRPTSVDLSTLMEYVITESAMFIKHDDIWVYGDIIPDLDGMLEDVPEVLGQMLTDLVGHIYSQDLSAWMDYAMALGATVTRLDDVVLNGAEHYVVSMLIAEDTFRYLAEWLFFKFLPTLDETYDLQSQLDLDLGAFVESEEFYAFWVFLDEFVNMLTLSMEFDMYVKQDSYEMVAYEMLMDMDFNTGNSPMIPENVGVRVLSSVTARILEYGLEIEFPEMESLMTQEEYMEMMFMQMMEGFEIPDHFPGQDPHMMGPGKKPLMGGK